MNITEKLRSIGQDKLLHFIGNAAISFFVFFVFVLFLNPYISVGIGFALSSLIAWLKEYIWDYKMGKGVYNKKDMMFGIVGAFSESLAILLTILIL